MDVGLKYMKELGMKPAKSLYQIETAVSRATKSDYRKKIFEAINKRAVDEYDNLDFYSIKNSDFKGSLAITGAFDADILREACNWIYDHQEYFSGDILEIGCDIGVISCFLGRLFPDRIITSIDRCEEAVKNANALAQQLKVNNVRFLLTTDPELKGREFDTVFSMRTIHENMTHDSVNDPFDLLWDLGMETKGYLSDYAKIVCNYMKEDGRLISIERISNRYVNLGWMFALNDFGIVSLPGLDKQIIRAREVGEIKEFPIIVGVKDQPIEEEAVYILFNRFFMEEIDDSASTYLGEEAALVLQNSVTRVVKWIALRNRFTKKIEAMYGLFETEDPTAIAMYEAHYVENGIFKRLRNADISLKDELLETLAEIPLNQVYKNHICEDYQYSDSLFKTASIREEIFHLN